MTMKTLLQSSRRRQQGSALAMTLIIIGLALAILASTMSWSAQNTRLTHRTVQYHRSVAAAEAATEKVLSQISRDYLIGGDKQVTDNLANYRATVPTGSDSSYWKSWEFNDVTTAGRTSVEAGAGTNYVLANSAYAGLRAYATTYRVAAHARLMNTKENVVGGVLQEVHLARIPIFQFAWFSSGDTEISCGQPFQITGRVHTNGKLYVEPDNALTFQSAVTAVSEILFQRHPLDTRGKPAGSVVYQVSPETPVPALTLPIGTTNSPEAIREIVQPPPTGESADSPLGRLRYYNLADMIITVTNAVGTNTGVTATSGKFNNFSVNVSNNDLPLFVAVTNSFTDARESKVVKPVDINIGVFTEWSRTNISVRTALGTNDVASVYIWDRRSLPSTNLSAVRVHNGQKLPPRGLTVATARPLYVQGHYNQTNNANLGTTNTTSARPASLVGDAITVLSTVWQDSKSTLAVGSRTAAPTTVNAAFLTGAVETTSGKYSGGVENFPRFLETWGSGNPFTYNGSMVKMFPSLYATNAWGKSDVYAPPKRDWAYDVSFNNPQKLPPLTPGLLTVIRGQWATLPPDKNYASASP
jgi:hypothetical protein